MLALCPGAWEEDRNMASVAVLDAAQQHVTGLQPAARYRPAACSMLLAYSLQHVTGLQRLDRQTDRQRNAPPRPRAHARWQLGGCGLESATGGVQLRGSSYLYSPLSCAACPPPGTARAPRGERRAAPPQPLSC